VRRAPGPAGGLGVTRAELNIAEVIERVGLLKRSEQISHAIKYSGGAGLF
jgi:hypothetical protein